MALVHHQNTGRRLLVTGGMIEPEVLARRIVLGIEMGERIRRVFPGFGREVRQIEQAIASAGRERDAQIAAAAQQIRAQMGRGVFLSKHLAGLAIDVRILDLTDAEVNSVVRAAREVGASARVVHFPPHVHVEFPAGNYVQ